MTDLELVADKLLTAQSAEDVFGPIDGEIDEQLAAGRRLYQRMSRVTHPDAHATAAPAVQELATRAFAALHAWWDKAQDRIHRGVYGKAQLGVITTKTAVYELDRVLEATDIATVYAGSRDGAPALIKVAKHPTVNDFLEREATALHTLCKTPAVVKYLPRLQESFLVKLDAERPRRVSVFEPMTGYVPLRAVMATYASGVDPRHVIWMWKRLLHVLDFAHQSDIVHAAVFPEHVYVHPENHGCILTEWGFAVAPGQKARALIPAHRLQYPPEVEAKQPLGPPTDLFLSAVCMLAVLGHPNPITAKAALAVPNRLTRLMSACLIASPRARTQSGRELYDEVNAAASALYGPPQYVPLQMA